MQKPAEKLCVHHLCFGAIAPIVYLYHGIQQGGRGLGEGVIVGVYTICASEPLLQLYT